MQDTVMQFRASKISREESILAFWVCGIPDKPIAAISEHSPVTYVHCEAFQNRSFDRWGNPIITIKQLYSVEDMEAETDYFAMGKVLPKGSFSLTVTRKKWPSSVSSSGTWEAAS